MEQTVATQYKFIEWGMNNQYIGHILYINNGEISSVQSLSHVWWLFVTLWTVAHQAPLSMGFSRQEYWSGLPCPSPGYLPEPGVKRVSLQFSSAQSLSRVRLFVTPWTTAHQASLSITNSWSLPKLMSIESVMPSNHLILCYPLLLLPSIFSSIKVFSMEK